MLVSASLLDDDRSLIGVDTDVAGGGDHWKLLPSCAWLLGRMEGRKAGLSGTVHCSVPVAMPVSRASRSVGAGFQGAPEAPAETVLPEGVASVAWPVKVSRTFLGAPAGSSHKSAQIQREGTWAPPLYGRSDKNFRDF